MTIKRRNHGRNKSGRGHTTSVRCSNCAKICPKDKACKRYIVRNMVEQAAMRDLNDANAFPTASKYQSPKMYLKIAYCISCAIHSRQVRVRSVVSRRHRLPPRKLEQKEGRVKK